MDNASKYCIPSSIINYYTDHIVRGFNNHVKELHDIACHHFVEWKSPCKPRFGKGCLSMSQSRLRFKSVLKYCQQNENAMRVDALAK